MVWKHSLWTYILRRLAKAQGFLDPMPVFANLQKFSKPSDVWVPTELLRSGAILQARGLINSQAIQHNLDWVWPFWVKRQFDPNDAAFIPRAFSISHINLTHRNWTALGVPDFTDFPLVDPRGLVTPFLDGWSIDAWILRENRPSLFPSALSAVDQKCHYQEDFYVRTSAHWEGLTLESSARVKMQENIPVCTIRFKATAPGRAWLAVCIRPYNPEGVSFIHQIKRLEKIAGWQIEGAMEGIKEVQLQQRPQRYVFSNYNLGDISQQIPLYFDNENSDQEISCSIGMASAAALYELEPNEQREVTVDVPLSSTPVTLSGSWAEHLEGHCQLQIPDELYKSLYDIALRTLILHSPGDIFPGPFTYKRFWFRDAAFILNAMTTVGLLKNVEGIIDRFHERQQGSGYFLSQDGEWDSNGQVLWIMQRFSALTNIAIKPEWFNSMLRAAEWIRKKRVFPKERGPHNGLLPAGFSAEHFGPNDYYYWDDFWAVAGLKAAAIAFEHRPALSHQYKVEAQDFIQCIEESLKLVELRINSVAVPASPYRRMDSAAIGSIVAGYPLQVWGPNDPRILETVNFLMKNCFLHGSFYHEISHSGINAYLTLHVAQVLLRAGDPRFFNIVKNIAQLATSTGQWPEAIHPRTKGGCMGDGQHVWAAAEWVLMIRNMFVREETNKLILCSGIPEEWLEIGDVLTFGPVLTVFGKISITVKVEKNIRISWKAQWYGEQRPVIEIRLAGHPKKTMTGKENHTEFNYESHEHLHTRRVMVHKSS